MISKFLTGCGLAVAASALATASFAGPAGTGLTFTEEVARKRVQARTLTAATAAQGCGAEVITGLEQRPDVARVRLQGQAVHVTFRSDRAATEHEATVRSLLGAACAGPVAANS